MKRKLLSILALLVAGVTGSWAETYTDEAVTVTWADPSSSSTGVADPSAAVSAAPWSGTSSGTGTWDGIKYTQVDAAQTFSFTFIPFPGLTFTPGSVEFDMVKFGSDNCFATIDIVYGDESEVQLANLNSKDDICRNKANVNADKRHKTYNLDNTKASSNAVTLKINLKPASGKTMGVANVVIKGKVSGTTASVTKYSVAVAANNDTYGTVGKSVDEVVDGNELTLTATPNRGYEFTNWTDNDNANAEVSTSAEYTFTPTANVNYTGNFTALAEYTVSVAANNDEAGTVSVNTFADSKYYAGDVVYLEARPNLGYVFTNWSDGSEDWQHAGITLSENVNLTANFTALPTPLSNASWNFNTGDGVEDAAVTNMAATVSLGSKVAFAGTQKSGSITYTKIQPTEKATGDDAFSVIFSLSPAMTEGQAFVVSSIELDAIRCGTSGGNFTIQVLRDGIVSKVASNEIPSESGTHYYLNLDDSKEAVGTVVVKLTLGGSLADNKQYGFANVKVNGYIREATPVIITPAADLTTYVTTKALDFSSVSGLTAYVVSAVSASNATLTQVNQVPANTGIILEGTAGNSYNVPVIASADAPATNLLKAAVKATDVEANAVYVLYGGEFCLVTEAGTVPAGKAYLLASDIPAASARPLTIQIGDKATGINKVQGEEVQGSEIYNLQGQRVVAPTKGLYIMNGKKVIIK